MKRPYFLVFFTVLLSISGIAGPGDTLYRNIRIGFVYSSLIFPTEWQQSPINAEGEVIDKGEIPRSLLVTIKALEKYPVEMLNLNLRSVYWLKKMSFYGVGYGGTNATAALYLTNDGERMGYTDNYLEQTFHHEFSSVLYRNYSGFFDSVSWKNANAQNFNYNDPEDGVGAIRNNASSQDLDTLICVRGMLTQYAMSSIENDLNTFAQNLFSPSEGFWEIVDHYPRIRRKTRLLINFYNRINPGFTESYFRKLALK